MSVSTDAAVWTFAAPDGSVASFDIGMVLDGDDVLAALYDGDGEEMTLSAFSVTGTGEEAGATVVFEENPDADGDADAELVIWRVTPKLQSAEIDSFGASTGLVQERRHDRIMLIAQELGLDLARAVRGPLYEDPMPRLPRAALRASKWAAFNSDGDMIASAGGAAGGVAISAVMEAVVEAATLALARTAMGVPGLADNNTFSGTNAFSNPGSVLASLVSFVKPGHRLSLTPALPVTIADVTGGSAGTIVWTPWQHNVSPVFDGTLWRLRAISEKSFVLDATNHLSGKNYDVFLDDNAGSPRLLTGPAWTSDVLRADAIGRNATYGWWGNNASITCRISNNGGTVVKTASHLLYLGTIRCAANGQAEDSAAKRFVWNMFNRVPRAMRVLESADSWSYATGTIRQANANAANQLDFVRGLDEDAVEAQVVARWANDTAGQAGFTLIGLDSTTTKATGSLAGNPSAGAANQIGVNAASWRGYPGLGRHTLTWLECGAGGTQTWSGDGGAPNVAQSGITGMVLA